jgi:biotin synthase
MRIFGVAEKVLNGAGISREEALSVLELSDEELPALLDEVFVVRKKYKGLKVGIQLLSSLRSGNCSQDCAYCAQARDSTAAIEKYRLLPYEAIAGHRATVADKKLARHCIGLSGIQFSDEEIEKVCAYVRALKEEAPAPVCCSIGFLSRQQAERLKAAGVDRINHNLNTSRAFYPNICTTHTYDQRIANIAMLREIGFELCCGGIAGLGESAADIVDMFFAIKEINPASVPVNFLIPIQGSGLEHRPVAALTPEYCLKVLALARLVLPRQDIRCAAGREVYLRGREGDVFRIADSIFASGYLTAGGQGVDETIALVKAYGFEYYLENP